MFKFLLELLTGEREQPSKKEVSSWPINYDRSEYSSYQHKQSSSAVLPSKPILQGGSYSTREYEPPRQQQSSSAVLPSRPSYQGASYSTREYEPPRQQQRPVTSDTFGRVSEGYRAPSTSASGTVTTRPQNAAIVFGTFNDGGRPAANVTLSTSAVSLVSHTHGRQRREERGIERRQLQEAVKYGRKERANPGRDGKTRWRYTHKGIVYITDETSRHEITSWKLEDAIEAPPPALGQEGAGKAHVVCVIDSSGSMRKDDVPGYPSRTAAVYDCLVRDLIEPQLKLGGNQVEVSIISMSDEAKVVLERHPLNQDLLVYLKGRKSSYAKSHGNYLPAVDKALELLAGDAACQSQLFLVFLSDGAPSDHTTMKCSHGIEVWQPCPLGPVIKNGKPRLQDCPVSRYSGVDCRATLHLKVRRECVEKIRKIGDLLGRDRVFVGTVAFGPPQENYDVLKGMAEALPRSSFQKLGLSVACLHTAFSSLASSLSELRSEVAPGGCGKGSGLTLRSDIKINAERQVYDQADVIVNGVKWDLYCGKKCRAKRRYDPRMQDMVDAPYSDAVSEILRRFPHMKELRHGVAHAFTSFGQGAERAVSQCTEVVSPDGGCTAYCVGPRLVAKSTKYKENMSDMLFHRTFCRIQFEAEQLAQLFNRRLRGGPEWQVRFLPCFVYTLEDERWQRGVVDILVEEELEGKFTKWNNNNGGVTRTSSGKQLGGGSARNVRLCAIAEDDEDDRDDDEREEDRVAAVQAEAEHVPQCFSHFTFHATDGKKLVCDLQGVWNPVDGFVLTDPVIHHNAGSKRNGATDKGPAGIQSFFATHVCNPLCRRLGLPPGPTVGTQAGTGPTRYF